MKNILFAALALAFAGGAQAAILSGTECEVTSVSGATQCAGIFSGNDKAKDLDGLFGYTDFVEVLKLDSSSGTEAGGGIELTVVNSGKTQTWAVDTYAGIDPVVFVLKGGPTYSAFDMDLSVLSGTWDNQSMLKGNDKRGAGLSHWTIYSATDPSNPGPGPMPAPDPIPLPAAGWLLIGGAGALGALRIRRKG